MGEQGNYPTFYTLLYINSDDNSTLSENSNSKLIDYIRCCKALNTSLEKQGHNLVVLTNNISSFKEHEKELKVRVIEFDLDVPKGIKFYSAHFKLDVFKYFSTLKSEYSILIDCDVVCINEMPSSMERVISLNIPMYYDITKERYPAYGRDKLIKDKKTLMHQESIGSWSGGEFIGGNDVFFDEIYLLCKKYWLGYKEKHQTLQHQGDEMLTSCAIEEFQIKGNFIFEVGSVGGISRFWSSNTMHVQNEFSSIIDNFLLHLPADKNIIANHTRFDAIGFISDYKRYLRKRKLRNFSVQLISKIKKMM
ncbi:MAG: hypothetical protein ACI8SA_000347 [Dokdonia sp.]|jgi:hypothetical protein